MKQKNLLIKQKEFIERESKYDMKIKEINEKEIELSKK